MDNNCLINLMKEEYNKNIENIYKKIINKINTKLNIIEDNIFHKLNIIKDDCNNSIDKN